MEKSGEEEKSKTFVNDAILLTGDIRMMDANLLIPFSKELQLLMIKYRVDKIDVSWSRFNPNNAILLSGEN